MNTMALLIDRAQRVCTESVRICESSARLRLAVMRERYARRARRGSTLAMTSQGSPVLLSSWSTLQWTPVPDDLAQVLEVIQGAPKIRVE